MTEETTENTGGTTAACAAVFPAGSATEDLTPASLEILLLGHRPLPGRRIRRGIPVSGVPVLYEGADEGLRSPP